MKTFNLQLLATETTGSLSAEMKTFYKTQLIENAKPQLHFNKYGDQYDIPKGNGKTISIRKFSAYAPATTPLTEGVTPNSHGNVVTEYNPTVQQYGDYVEESCMLKMTAVDPIIAKDTELNSDQMALTLDCITRNELAGGTNVYYSPKMVGGVVTPVTSRGDLDKTALLTGGAFRKTAAYLKGVNGKTFNGSFIAIVHPHVSAAIQDDKSWIDASKYAKPEQLLDGEIGRLYGVRVLESSNAKIWKNETCPIDKDVAPDYSSSKTYSKGDIVNHSSKIYEAKQDISTAEAWTEAHWTEITDGTGRLPVYATEVFAKHAYATTKITGFGSEVIVKGLGEGQDPLNQRSTVGWKANHVAKRLGEEFLVRIESTSEFTDTDAN